MWKEAVVGIVIRLQDEFSRNRDSFRSSDMRFVFCPTTWKTGLGTHQASYSMGPEAFSACFKRWTREVVRSPPSSVQVKNEWSYTSKSFDTVYRDKFIIALLSRPLLWVSVFQNGFRGTLGFHRTSLGVPREIVE
jgi:hypothetical protein